VLNSAQAALQVRLEGKQNSKFTKWFLTFLGVSGLPTNVQYVLWTWNRDFEDAEVADYTRKRTGCY